MKDLFVGVLLVHGAVLVAVILQAARVAAALCRRADEIMRAQMVDTSPCIELAEDRQTTFQLRRVERHKALEAVHAWSGPHWDLPPVSLRCGPDYPKHKLKRPTGEPLLCCTAAEAFRTDCKIFSEGIKTHSSYLLPSCYHATAASASTSLPKWLVISALMPTYTGSAADGPCIKWMLYFEIPTSLESDASAAGALLRDFLLGSASGHSDSASYFYDRFKVIVRQLASNEPLGPFLKRAVRWFDGKPMLWRWFGVWGNCIRNGDVTFLNLDFCTGGRLKNQAFARGAPKLRNFVVEFSFTLEARTDAEMPERLIGGASFCRLNIFALPKLVVDSQGVRRKQ
mmetsp:Transcript_5208/g.8742  ORF Transcript_5208/g.8742 Transcript_5208/m.8742 type:complete len:341 (+) Transcript_5208:146-1168(+)